MMKMTSGPAQVVASGDATTFFGQPLRIELVIDDEPFVLEWVFEEGEEASLVAEELPHGRRFRCRGLDDRPGRGTAEPVLVAELAGDALMVHFRTTRWGQSADRTLHYTLFRLAAGALDV